MLINHFIIKRYAKSLAAVEKQKSAAHPTAQQVLDVLVARDGVQRVLDNKILRVAMSLEEVKELDERLKGQGEVIAGTVELADYRATVSPVPDAWWWFFDREPAHLLARYDNLLTALEQSAPNTTANQVEELLKTRDALRKSLASQAAGTLVIVMELDERLKKQREVIAGTVKLPDCRERLNPSPEAWWWFFDTEMPPRFRRFNWLLGWLTSVPLIISMVFLVDIGLRFLTDRFDLITVLPVFLDAVLAALIGKGAFTDAGRVPIEAFLARLNQPKYYWQAIKFVLAVLFLCLIFFFRQDRLPCLASWYHAQARADLKADQLQSAQAKYQVAINLDPTFAEAHYNLGSLSEDLFDFDRARTEYGLAVAGGLDAAYNNLARLHILEENYSPAVTLLLKGLEVAQDDHVRYDMLKNLAWARVAQGRHAEALPYLTDALEVDQKIEGEKAPAHCLLAQVLDAQEKNAEALTEWENCLRLANQHNPDEDLWIGMARNRLTSRSADR